jgi:hypothetical protein
VQLGRLRELLLLAVLMQAISGQAGDHVRPFPDCTVQRVHDAIVRMMMRKGMQY